MLSLRTAWKLNAQLTPIPPILPAFKAHLQSPPSSSIQSSLYCFHSFSPFKFLYCLLLHLFSKDFESYVLFPKSFASNPFAHFLSFVFCPSAISCWFTVFILNIRTPKLQKQGTLHAWLKVDVASSCFPRIKSTSEDCGSTGVSGSFAIIFNKTMVSLGMIISLTKVKILAVLITTNHFLSY